MYADYAYYSAIYGGRMSEDDYLRCGRDASAYIRKFTYGRAPGTTTAQQAAAKDACCAAADEIRSLERRGGAVTSESNSGVSVSYADTGSAEDRIRAAAALYLINTGLMDRSVHQC